MNENGNETMDNPLDAPMLRAVADAMGIRHRSAAAMLTLLLPRPGVPMSRAALAENIGISQKSVRVFAFFLRQWLDTNDLEGILQTHSRLGYSLSPRGATLLLQRYAVLHELVATHDMPQPPEAAGAQSGGGGSGGGEAPARDECPEPECGDVEVAGCR